MSVCAGDRQITLVGHNSKRKKAKASEKLGVAL
jgi:hypothetical protein